MPDQADSSRSSSIIVGVAVAGAILLFTLWSVMRGPDTSEAAVTPERRAALREEAYRHVRANELAQAHKLLDALLKADPDDPDAHMIRAQAQLADGDVAGAIASFQRVLSLESDNADAHYNLGQLMRKKGDLVAAREHLARAVIIDPGSTKFAIMLAQAHMDLNELDPARVQLLRALTLNANLPEAHGRLAEIAARDGNLSVAIEQANKALELVRDDDDRTLRYTLMKAKLLRRANQPEQALAVLVSLPPSQIQRHDTVEHITACYMMMGRPLEAAGRWVTLFALEPTDVAAAAEAGICFVRAGELAEARRYLGFAQRIDPNHRRVSDLDAELRAKAAQPANPTTAPTAPPQ